MNIKHVKTYEEFKKELNESRTLDEGILSSIKSGLKKIGDFFMGIGSLFLNSLLNQNDKFIPASVTIFPNKSDIAVLQQNKESVKIPSYKSIIKNEKVKTAFESEDVTDKSEVNESVLALTYPGGEHSVQDIDAKQFEKELKILIERSQDSDVPAPLLVWGAPGIGKTSIIKSIAEAYEMSMHNGRLICQDLATADAVDFLLPSPAQKVDYKKNKEGRSTRLIIDWLPVYDSTDKSKTIEQLNAEANGVDGKGGVIFFDEVARCKRSVQNVIMKLCDADRRINEWVLGDKWVILAAANREKDQGDNDSEFSWNTTLGNRFTQYNFVPKVEEWQAYAMEINPKTKEPRVDDTIIGFISFKPDYFHRFDPDKEDVSGGKGAIYPSPRKWEDASKKIRAIKKYSDKHGEKIKNDDIERAIAGEVGPAAAKQYMGYLNLLKDIDPKDIQYVYTDPDKAPKLKSLKLDQQTVLISAVAMADLDINDNKKLLNVTDWAIKGIENPKLGVLFIKMLQKYHPEIKKNTFWAEECMNRFFDAFPELTETKE